MKDHGLRPSSGWSMLMDYLLNPIICAIRCAAVLGTFQRGMTELSIESGLLVWGAT